MGLLSKIPLNVLCISSTWLIEYVVSVCCSAVGCGCAAGCSAGSGAAGRDADVSSASIGDELNLLKSLSTGLNPAYVGMPLPVISTFSLYPVTSSPKDCSAISGIITALIACVGTITFWSFCTATNALLSSLVAPITGPKWPASIFVPSGNSSSHLSWTIATLVSPDTSPVLEASSTLNIPTGIAYLSDSSTPPNALAVTGMPSVFDLSFSSGDNSR